MLRQRGIDLRSDRALLLDFHCLCNYHSESPWARDVTFEEYRREWLKTPQPAAFLEVLGNTLEDKRTIAELWLEDGEAVGFLWVTLSDIEGYGLRVAEVENLAVAPDFQRRGIGAEMLAHAEELARERGAQIVRSEVGIENQASQGLHEGAGYEVYHLRYEKIIDAEGDATDDVPAEETPEVYEAWPAVDSEPERFPPREQFPRL